jgi:hypothetical protein
MAGCAVVIDAVERRLYLRRLFDLGAYLTRLRIGEVDAARRWSRSSNGLRVLFAAGSFGMIVSCSAAPAGHVTACFVSAGTNWIRKMRASRLRLQPST